MAMINRIRKRSGLLIIVIGGAMVAFLLGGILRQGGCQRQRPERPEAGSIYGKGIPQAEYEQRVRTRIQRLKKQRQEEIGQEIKAKVRDRVWKEMVRERVFQKQISELGIEVPSEELKDLLAGENVHPRIRRIFQQQTGTFNKEMVLRRISQTFRNSQQARQQWSRMAENIMQDRAYSKFTNLVQKAMFANSSEVKDAFQARERKVDFEYVRKPYGSLPDKKVDLSESDVRDYYNKHKEDPEYEQESSRSFQYVIVDASPSESDIQESRNDMESLKDRFERSRNDSLFAANQSGRPGSPIEYLGKGDLEDESADSLLFQADTGDVIGPVQDGERFMLYKVLGRPFRPDSVKASHILLGRGVRGKTDSLMQIADSLKKELEAGADFDQLAEQVSEDPNSARKGGSLGWIQPGDMLPAFDSAIFQGDTNAYPLIRTRAGLHLIDVEERTEAVQQYRTAVVESEVAPSSKTLEKAYNKASNLAIKSEGDSSFNAIAKEQGFRLRLASRVKESDRSVARLENSRQLVRWAYEAEQGAVSKAMRCGERFVVALLTEVRKEGVPSFANVREDMRAEVLQKKKADRFKRQMKGAASLDSLASAYGLEVRTANGISFNSNSLPGAGNEPRVIGKVLQVKKGHISKPIRGNSGVYVAAVMRVEEAGEATDMRLARLKQKMERKRSRRVQRDLFNILKEHAKVEDERNTLR